MRQNARQREQDRIKSAAWRKRNPQKALEVSRNSHKKNREKERVYGKEWREQNKGKMRQREKERWIKNKEIMGAAFKKRYYENKERFSDRRKRYVALNKEKVAQGLTRWRRNNSDKVNSYIAERRAGKLSAMPGWANKFFLNEAYALTRLRTKVMGFKWHVDHIVPLKSKIVCGLHTERNIRVIPAIANQRKYNTFWPEMP